MEANSTHWKISPLRPSLKSPCPYVIRTKVTTHLTDKVRNGNGSTSGLKDPRTSPILMSFCRFSENRKGAQQSIIAAHVRFLRYGATIDFSLSEIATLPNRKDYPNYPILNLRELSWRST